MSERFNLFGNEEVPKSVGEVLAPSVSGNIEDLEARLAFELANGNKDSEEARRISDQLSHLKQQEQRIIDKIAGTPLSKPVYSGNIATMEEPNPVDVSTEGVEELRKQEIETIRRITEELEELDAKGEDSQPDFARIDQLNLEREQARRRLNELSG